MVLPSLSVISRISSVLSSSIQNSQPCRSGSAGSVSKGSPCSCSADAHCRPNASGNLLDKAILDEIKTLTEENSVFTAQLERSRRFFTGNRDRSEVQRTELRAQLAQNEKTVTGLVDSLALAGDSLARTPILRRIEELTGANREIGLRLRELEGRQSADAMSDADFDRLRQMLSRFPSCVDGMTVEEKRSALRVLVRRVVWDGRDAHVMLFGTEEDLPPDGNCINSEISASQCRNKMV